MPHATSRQLHNTTQLQPHELALFRPIILGVTSHGLVQAGHPRYAHAQYVGKAVCGSTVAHEYDRKVYEYQVSLVAEEDAATVEEDTDGRQHRRCSDSSDR